MLGFFMLQVIGGMIRREPAALSRAALGLAKSILGSFVALALLATALEITDQLCIGIVNAAGTNMEQMGDKHRPARRRPGRHQPRRSRRGRDPDHLHRRPRHRRRDAIVWISLLIRKALLLIAIVFAPIALAGASWDHTRTWVSKWASFVIALIVSKVVLVVIFLLATAQVSAPIDADLQSVSEPIAGVVLMLMAGFAPYMTYKAIAFMGFDMYHAMSAEQEAKAALNRPDADPDEPRAAPGSEPSKVLDGGSSGGGGSGSGGGGATAPAARPPAAGPSTGARVAPRRGGGGRCRWWLRRRAGSCGRSCRGEGGRHGRSSARQGRRWRARRPNRRSQAQESTAPSTAHPCRPRRGLDPGRQANGKKDLSNEPPTTGDYELTPVKFSRLTRRGVLLGLSGSQLTWSSLASERSSWCSRSISAAPSLLYVFPILLLCVALAFVGVGGRKLIEWAPVGADGCGGQRAGNCCSPADRQAASQPERWRCPATRLGCGSGSTPRPTPSWSTTRTLRP
jgi:type IV secretion system protein TrbL